MNDKISGGQTTQTDLCGQPGRQSGNTVDSNEDGSPDGRLLDLNPRYSHIATPSTIVLVWGLPRVVEELL